CAAASVGVRAEAVRGRFEHRERLHVGLLLRSVHAPWAERNGHGDAGISRGLLDSSATSQDDQVSEGDLLTARLRAIELILNLFERLQHLLQLLRLIDLPILLRTKTDARPVCAATLV